MSAWRNRRNWALWQCRSRMVEGGRPRRWTAGGAIYDNAGNETHPERLFETKKVSIHSVTFTFCVPATTDGWMPLL